MLGIRGCVLLALLLTAPMTVAIANVIFDWDEKAASIVQPGTVFRLAATLRDGDAPYRDV
jgi:hypothetical protein